VKSAIKLFVTVCCLVFISTAWAASLPTAKPDEVGLSSQRLDRIDAVLKDDVEKGKLAGATLLIARKGKVAYFKTFGMQNKEAGISMEKDSIFRIYSMTKPFVSVATMILMEEGKLRLSDPVSKYIPAFKDVQVAVYGKDAEGKDTVTTEKPTTVMTVFHLLTHTSGLTYGWSVPKAFQGEYYKIGLKSDWTIAEQSDALAKLPLQFNTGAKYMYSRSFDVLGRVVEVASGMPLDQLIQRQ
jgi:CubicO group peptidase (beta-lactamase class C family)